MSIGPDEDLGDFTVSYSKDTPPPAACQDLASAILGKAGPGVRTVDPELLWKLAAVIAAVVSACAAAHVAAQLRRIKQHPDGLLARFATRRFASKLPDTLGADDRHSLATLAVQAGTEIVDDPDRWNRLYA